MPKYPFNRVAHYIPPAEGFVPIKHEFVEPNSSDHFIHWLFSYRCMECRRNEQLEINEINLRSRSKNAIKDWKNRVVLCRSCHTKFHANGVTAQKIADMLLNRAEYLSSIGREKYV